MSQQPEPPSAESEALTRYRSASRRRGTTGRQLRRKAVRSAPFQATGRDPQLLSEVWRGLAEEQGWTVQLAIWSLTNRWAQIVGPQVADHVAVEQFRTDDATGHARAAPGQATLDEDSPAVGGGTLTLRADSAVWQQQLVWNLAALQRRLDAELGRGVVGRIVVLGPQERRRSYGPRRVRS